VNIYQHIYDYLRTDAVLVGTQTSPPGGSYSGLLTGGLWNRPLKRAGMDGPPIPGSTPAAFGDANEAGRIRYAASLIDNGDTPHFQELSIPTTFQMSLSLYLYAPAHESGKQTLRQVESRVYDLLHNYRFQTDDGPYARVFFASRFGIVDSEEFMGAVADYCRYQVVARHREEL
jgi:hypothetical protein